MQTQALLNSEGPLQSILNSCEFPVEFRRTHIHIVRRTLRYVRTINILMIPMRVADGPFKSPTQGFDCRE